MNSTSTIKVWDPLVRLFHWLLVASVAVTWVTEDEFLVLHVYAGYLIAGLLGFRLIWGFIGPRYARFSDFVTSPSRAIAYTKEVLQFRSKRFIGHNPAGGMMIVVLLVSLLITVFSGLVAYGIEGYGPLAQWLHSLGAWDDETFEEIHEFFANFTLLLVLVHVTGVVFESLLHKENLVLSMINGRKRK